MIYINVCFGALVYPQILNKAETWRHDAEHDDIQHNGTQNNNK